MNVAKLLVSPLVILLINTIPTVLGCGVMPPGQVSTTSFTVTGFTLPVAMVYTETPAASARVPGIATSKGGAQAFVQRLVMQTVFDVLERQGSSALLPDAVISAILSQLEVRITYEPLQCQDVALDPKNDKINNKDTPQRCIVVDTMVTAICAKTDMTMAAFEECTKTTNKATVTPVPANLTSIIGTLTTRKHHYGELAESDVAKCIKQSAANVGITSIWITLLLGIWDHQRKLKLN